MFQLWCSHVFIHAAGIGQKNWCDVSVESAPVKETHPQQRKHCTICREIISTDLPFVPSLSGAACPRRLWLLKLSGLLWYLTHSAVELFTPKTNLKFAQHYRICRKYCRSLNCSFKKSLNGTKQSSSFRSSGPLCVWRSLIVAFSRCFQSKWNNIEHRVVLLCYVVKR